MLINVHIHPLRAARCLATLLLLTGSLGSCSKKDVSTQPVVKDSTYYNRIEFIIQDNFSLSIFSSALTIMGLSDTLSNPGPFTVFTPDNNAFNHLGIGGLGKDQGSLLLARPLAAYHVQRGMYPLHALPLGDNHALPSSTGASIFVSKYLLNGDTVFTANGKLLKVVDRKASNGLIQLPAEVMYPMINSNVMDKIRNDTALSLFSLALRQAHLDTLLGGSGIWTVLAPTNAALIGSPALGWSSCLSTVDSITATNPDSLAKLLKYYILPGRYFLNDMARGSARTDTAFITMLNGETLRVALTQDGTAPEGIRVNSFIGVGNQAILDQNPGSSPDPVAYLYWANSYNNTYVNYFDMPTGNGVVHTITQVLIP